MLADAHGGAVGAIVAEGRGGGEGEQCTRLTPCLHARGLAARGSCSLRRLNGEHVGGERNGKFALRSFIGSPEHHAFCGGKEVMLRLQRGEHTIVFQRGAERAPCVAVLVVESTA